MTLKRSHVSLAIRRRIRSSAVSQTGGSPWGLTGMRVVSLDDLAIFGPFTSMYSARRGRLISLVAHSDMRS